MISENPIEEDFLEDVLRRKKNWEKITIIYLWEKYVNFSKVDNKTDYLRLINKEWKSIFVEISKIDKENIVLENINPIDIDIKTKIMLLLWKWNKSATFSRNWWEEVHYKKNNPRETLLEITTTKKWEWDKYYVLDNDEIKVWNYQTWENKLINKEEEEELSHIIDSSSNLLTLKKEGSYKRDVQDPSIEQNEVPSYKDKTFTTIDWKLTWDINKKV